jgi:ribonucleoside-diphosphate reductase alpha chain
MVLFKTLDIPQDLKDVQNSLEMSMKDIDMSRHRGYFVDQSQSLNLFYANTNYSKLTSIFMHGAVWIENWNVLRTKAAVDAIKFAEQR